MSQRVFACLLLLACFLTTACSGSAPASSVPPAENVAPGGEGEVMAGGSASSGPSPVQAEGPSSDTYVDASGGAADPVAKKTRPLDATPSAQSPALDEESAEAGDFDDGRDAAPAKLGTNFGEARYSHIRVAPFLRAHAVSPDAVLSIWYEDDSGRRRGWFRRRPRATVATTHPPLVTLSMIGEDGRPLRARAESGRVYARGREGQRYTLEIQNDSPERMEAVVSVDGIDVLDGDVASYNKRGYIVEAHGKLRITGWRTSTKTVAVFRFGPQSLSYATRTGRPRNVGVVGVALFREAGPTPFPEQGFVPPPPT